MKKQKDPLYLDLNKTKLTIDESFFVEWVENPQVQSKTVDVYFRDIKTPLIDFISKHKMIVGCVAWLTDIDILEALKNISCALVVQKEDFLRPDYKGWQREKLQPLYRSIKCSIDRYDFPPPLSRCSVNGDPGFDGVRCVGNHNREKEPGNPRMHHKFLVGGDIQTYQYAPSYTRTRMVPKAVWTGSFNFTNTSTRSLENAVVIRIPQVVKAYFQEFSNVMAISEPLNWEDDWISPEWRIGT